MRRVRIIGAGRAGSALARALDSVGWAVEPIGGREADVSDAAEGVDLVVIATPDSVIASVARAIEPVPETAVAHLAGSLGTAVLEPHRRRVALHPLVALPDAEIGSRRLCAGAWFALAGDPIGREVVEALGGSAVEVADQDRALYHAAAVVASNHLVVLLAQVERLAARAGVDPAAYFDLARGSLDNVAELGAAAALTGPAARGDDATIAAHIAAIGEQERSLYEALALQARRVAGADDD